MKKILICITMLLLSLNIMAEELPEIKPGDIIFQNSQSSQAKAIELATHSFYTHVGIILYKNNKPYVLEAVQPVKYTELSKWIKRGKDNKFAIKRIIHADSVLTDSLINRIQKVGESYLKKNYDIYFDWTDEEMYCSELVWKIYKRGANITLCDLHSLREYDLSHPIVKKTMERRYGTTPPLDSSMVSPQNLFDSELLISISSN